MVHHSSDFKKSAVKYYLKIKNYVEVCKIYECNRISLMRWVKLYNENNLISNHNKTKKSIKKIKKSHYKNHFTNSLQNNFDNKKIITYKTKKKYKN